VSTPITVTAVQSLYVAGGPGFTGTSPFYSAQNSNTAGVAPGSAVLATGFNSIPIPAAAEGVDIIPPSGNTATLTLKGLTGDTGQGLSATQITRLWFTAAGAQANLGITAGAAVTLTLGWL
jgi:hypothetical protein